MMLNKDLTGILSYLDNDGFENAKLMLMEIEKLVPYYEMNGDVIYNADRLKRKEDAIVDEYLRYWRLDETPLQLEILILLGGISELGKLNPVGEDNKIFSYGKVSLDIVEKDFFPKMRKPFYQLNRRIVREVLPRLNKTYYQPHGDITIVDRYYDALYSIDNYLWITKYTPEEIVSMYTEYIRNTVRKRDRENIEICAIIRLLNEYQKGPIKKVRFSDYTYKKIKEFIQYLIDRKNTIEGE